MATISEGPRTPLVIGRDSHGASYTTDDLALMTATYAWQHRWAPDAATVCFVWPESRDHGRDYDRTAVWHFSIRRPGAAMNTVPLVAGHLHLERDEDGVIRAVHVERVDPVTPFFYA